MSAKVSLIPNEDGGLTVIRDGFLVGEVAELGDDRWAHRTIITIFVDEDGRPRSGVHTGWSDRFRTKSEARDALIADYDRIYPDGKRPKVERG